MTLTKSVINFNSFETVKETMIKDEVIFYSERLFMLRINIEEYVEAVKKLAYPLFADENYSRSEYFMVGGRLESEIFTSMIEKTHPIHVVTTYLVYIFTK